MAIHKIFPEKTATLFSFYPTLNSGVDEIMEISLFNPTIDLTAEVSRGLIKFDKFEVENFVERIQSFTWDAYLKMYLAYATAVPLEYTIYAHPISGSWDQGTGRVANAPITTDGVSWSWRNYYSGSDWFETSSFDAGTTGSYTNTTGGGAWWTGSRFIASQSFASRDSKDIEMNITNIVYNWWVQDTINEGLIIKHSPSLEFNSSSFETKYFTGNTHTIYPPCLEFRWDDSAYDTGSLSVVSDDLFVASIGNNKGEYEQDSVQRFRINVRDKYPVRTFQTSSIYLNNKLLPSSSYWSLVDYDTKEIVIDYDTTYTKISADGTSNYFDIYMNGLQPERSYKLLLKAMFGNGEIVISNNNHIFKVIR